MYVYVYMYVDTHVWAYLCVCGNINTHITHMYVSIYACMNVHMHSCLYVCVYMWLWINV